MNKRRVRVLVVLGALGALLVGGQAVAAPSGSNWTTAGGDRTNSRFAANERQALCGERREPEAEVGVHHRR